MTTVPDDERPVELLDEDFDVLPDQTRDESDLGWGEVPPAADDYLNEERPPHW